MSSEIKHRRGTEAEHSTFTGANGEITVNTSTGGLRVHDGLTVGGKSIGDSAQTVTATGTTTPRSLAKRAGDVLYIEDFGAVADVVLAADGSESSDTGTDNTQAFYAAIQAAGNSSTDYATKGKVIDLGGKTYGVKSPIRVLSDTNGFKIQNGNIVALPNWTGQSGEGIINIGNGGTSTTQVVNVLIDNVNCICRKRTSGFLFDGCQKVHVQDCKSLGFTEFGFKTATKTGELTLLGCNAYEYEFNDTRNNTWANRTGIAFHMNTADTLMLNCTGAVTKYPYRADAGFNYQVTQCHFWVGIINDKPDNGNVPVMYIDGAANGIYTNTYVDAGIVTIKGNFHQTFNGINVAAGTTGTTRIGFDLIATQPNERADKLSITSGYTKFHPDGFFRYSVDGAGSWSRPAHIVSGFTGYNNDAAPATKLTRNLDITHTSIKQYTEDDDAETSAYVCNMVPSYTSIGKGYNQAIAVASFDGSQLQYPSFITASSPSGLVGDYNAFHTSGDTFGQFWSTTSSGANFGQSGTPYIGGAGFRAVASENHSPSALGSELQVWLTDAGGVTPVPKYRIKQDSISPYIGVARSLGEKFLRWAAVWTEKVYFGGSNIHDSYGSGSPEGVVTADVGSTYRRTNGGAGTSFYVKESGTGNTGWVAK